uniref:Uncharacterized protein n=1 Tax=Bracon brevicornis TaxID=1563983 RepID=A0A6V7J2V0_9HYME
MQSAFEVLTLRELSHVAVCRQLWDQYNVKEMLKASRKEVLSQHKPDEKVLAYVYSNIDQLGLPKTLASSLKKKARVVGIMIWRWLENIHRANIYIDSRFIDHISWTSHLTIDTAKTVESMYWADVFPHSECTWMLLSFCCVRDCIHHFYHQVYSMSEKILERQLHFSKKRKLTCNHAVMLLAYYWSKCMKGQLDECKHYLDRLYGRHTVYYRAELQLEINVCRIVGSYSDAAFKYFWQEGKHYNGDIYYWLGIECFKSSKLGQPDSSKVVPVMDQLFSMEKLMFWPWHDFNAFERLFKKFLVDSGLKRLRDMMINFCKIVASSGHWYNENDQISNMFKLMWNMMDEHSKRTHSWTLHIKSLHKHSELMGLILYDPALKNRKRMHLKYIAKTLGRQENSEANINRICNEVLRYDEDRRLFMKRCRR